MNVAQGRPVIDWTIAGKVNEWNDTRDQCTKDFNKTIKLSQLKFQKQ